MGHLPWLRQYLSIKGTHMLLQSPLRCLASGCKHCSHIILLARQGLPSENETKKRQRLKEMKEYEGGKRCLSPSIFRKSKGPVVLTASSAAIATASEAPSKAGPGVKRAESMAREVTLQDYDVNQCLDLKDVHRKYLI